MAASTKAPTAMMIPPRDMMLAVTPIILNGMKEISTATGMVITGMMALGKCHRKIRITRETVISTSTRVDFMLPMARWIKSERS